MSILRTDEALQLQNSGKQAANVIKHLPELRYCPMMLLSRRDSMLAGWVDCTVPKSVEYGRQDRLRHAYANLSQIEASTHQSISMTRGRTCISRDQDKSLETGGTITSVKSDSAKI